MKSIIRRIKNCLGLQKTGADLFMEQLSDSANVPTDSLSLPKDMDIDQSYDYALTEKAWKLSGLLEQDPEIQKMVADCRQELEVRRNKRTGNMFLQQPVLRGVALASIVVATVCLGFLHFSMNASQHYSTAVGQKNFLTLTDGSTMLLNTDSAVNVTMSEHAREVELLQGEVFFNVVNDKNRDFVVIAGNGKARVLGTQFNVDRRKDGVTVSVVSGTVEVASGKQQTVPESTAIISQGQAVQYTNTHGEQTLLQADLARISAWQNGELSFNGVPLQQAVSEHNRYSRKKIILADDKLKTVEITGAFKTGDTEEFLYALENLFDINVKKDGNKIVIVNKIKLNET